MTINLINKYVFSMLKDSCFPEHFLVVLHLGVFQINYVTNFSHLEMAAGNNNNLPAYFYIKHHFTVYKHRCQVAAMSNFCWICNDLVTFAY